MFQTHVNVKSGKIIIHIYIWLLCVCVCVRAGARARTRGNSHGFCTGCREGGEETDREGSSTRKHPFCKDALRETVAAR